MSVESAETIWTIEAYLNNVYSNFNYSNHQNTPRFANIFQTEYISAAMFAMCHGMVYERKIRATFWSQEIWKTEKIRAGYFKNNNCVYKITNYICMQSSMYYKGLTITVWIQLLFYFGFLFMCEFIHPSSVFTTNLCRFFCCPQTKKKVT